MSTTTKSLATARELLDLLEKEVATTLPVQVETFDTDGNPVITLSADATPAAGEKVIVLRVMPISWTATDIIGHTSQIYTPHKIQICTEANKADGGGDDILTPVELLPVLAEVCRRGMIVEWYQSANGAVPATTEITASNLKKGWHELYWNAMKAQ